MNLDIYSDQITHEGLSVFSGGAKNGGTVHYSELEKFPVLKAFLDDDDLQEITIASSNIGFVRTYRKQFIKKVGR